MDEENKEVSLQEEQKIPEEPATVSADEYNKLNEKLSNLEQSFEKLNKSMSMFIDKGGVISETSTAVQPIKQDEPEEEPYVSLAELDYTL